MCSARLRIASEERSSIVGGLCGDAGPSMLLASCCSPPPCWGVLGWSVAAGSAPALVRAASSLPPAFHPGNLRVRSANGGDWASAEGIIVPCCIAVLLLSSEAPLRRPDGVVPGTLSLAMVRGLWKDEEDKATI